MKFREKNAQSSSAHTPRVEYLAHRIGGIPSSHKVRTVQTETKAKSLSKEHSNVR
jgi:hypothetical protein